MGFIILQDIVYIFLLICLSIPLGLYIYTIMEGSPGKTAGIFKPIEKGIYRFLGIRGDGEMSPGQYAAAVLVFSGIGLVFVFLLQIFQGLVPFNPENLGAVEPALAFNTSASFISNTNWQAYSGENTLSYLTQALGLGVQNFVSAATGIAVMFVLIRGFTRKRQSGLGNFWKDLTRITLYILLPLSVLWAVLLISQGVVQSFDPYQTVQALENGEPGKIPLGPAASQIAIKQLGTNGGGFFGANSAYPLENPTPFSNFLQLLGILLIPAALCVTFGKAVKDMAQGRSIYMAMMILFTVAVICSITSEMFYAPRFNGVDISGNMEGKEVIHGVGTSSLWSAVTTAASSGSVNSMHDSFTPLGGLIPMFLMQLGEVVFGGVGSGLYGMIGFVLLTVFIAGLLVGRTPEYLGKKIESFDMKMVCIILLVPPLATLISTAWAVLMPQAEGWILNKGPHGFSEILYAYTSMGNNNGSAFAGFSGNTLFTNILGGIVMLLVRFIPMTAAIYLAGNLGTKKIVAAGDGTLSSSNAMFTGLLIGIIILVAALSFLPALALGPIADAMGSY